LRGTQRISPSASRRITPDNEHVRRWVSNLFRILSLLVFVTGTAIWARGYFVPADLEWFRRHTDATLVPPLTRTLGVGISWGPGTIGIFHYHGESSLPSETARTWIYREFDRTRTLNATRAPTDRVNLLVGSFQFLHRIEPAPGGWLSLRIVVVPAWFSLAALIPPLLWVSRRTRRGAARPRSCKRYNRFARAR
jgi:hypothetical protein